MDMQLSRRYTILSIFVLEYEVEVNQSCYTGCGGQYTCPALVRFYIGAGAKPFPFVAPLPFAGPRPVVVHDQDYVPLAMDLNYTLFRPRQ